MGKKKRGHPDVEEVLARPWCYYCERDFEDLKLLISHQKAKHFKCDRCGKRLNTAGGLSVHMNQVHKETLTSVENALPNRQGLDIEIFGMEGVPEDIIQQHNQRIIQTFYTEQAERRAATGNPPPGQAGSQRPAKRFKIESPEEIKKRLAEHRAKVAARKAAEAAGIPLPVEGQSPSQVAPPFAPPQVTPSYPYPAAGAPAYPPAYPAPGGPSPPPGAPGAFNLPARPTAAGVPAALPQRPPFGFPGGAAPPGYPGALPPSTVDELVASAARQSGGPSDDIDQMIRLAEAGIKPQQQKEEAPAPAEKKKKDKGMRMVYGDSEVSPEEKTVSLPRYRWVEGEA